MGLLDRFRKSTPKRETPQETEKTRFTTEDAVQAFRQACWDLYISNLPDPKIIDANPEEKTTKREEVIPRGFFIDPKTWTITFNSNDIPKQITERSEKCRYARSIFQHEDTHFTKVPADGLTEAILIDSALKGFKDQNILTQKEQAKGYAYTTLNIFGDLIGDTFLAKENYGRENYGEMTLWRMKETIKSARDTPQTPSAIWQTLVRSYELLWNEDLGLTQIVQQKDKNTEKAAQDLVSILGKDWKDRSTWEQKIKKFAEVLEPIIKQSTQQAQQQQGQSKYGQGNKGKQGQEQSGSGSEMPMPDDITTQMGNPTESPLNKTGQKEKDGKGQEAKSGDDKDKNNGNGTPTYIDDQILDEIYQRNKESPGKFAGTLGALKGLEPNDALRLMYRARAKELLISLKEKENQRAEKNPSYQTGWNIGDPLLGKGGLEIIPSMMASGKPIPGLTTYKRKMEASQGHGKLKMIPDIFIEIDSSGSMDWNPWTNPPDARGDFDKAILAAEGAALYALDNGGRVAVINFSGEGNITTQKFTTNIDNIEKAIMINYHGGTTVPIKETKTMIKRTSNPLLTCLMSDCEIGNWQEACDDALSHSITEHDDVAVFNIGRGGSSFTNRMKEKGAIIYKIKKIEDLAGMIIGEVKRKYDKGCQDDD